MTDEIKTPPMSEDAILVVYSFAKKTQTTPKTVIDLCRKRLALYDSMK